MTEGVKSHRLADARRAYNSVLGRTILNYPMAYKVFLAIGYRIKFLTGSLTLDQHTYIVFHPG
jgi:hypothetical protein